MLNAAGGRCFAGVDAAAAKKLAQRAGVLGWVRDPAPAAIDALKGMLRKRFAREIDLEGQPAEKVEAVCARLGVGDTPDAPIREIGRKEFDQILDGLGLDDGGPGGKAEMAERCARRRDAIWALLDANGTGRVSAREFIEFWASTFPEESE